MLGGLAIKVLGTLTDLGLPWVLAFMIDDVIPKKKPVFGSSLGRGHAGFGSGNAGAERTGKPDGFQCGTGCDAGSSS